MKKLLSDDFYIHDKFIDDVCKKIEFDIFPSWQHKWFYRYLQISFSYRYVHHWECEKEKQSPLRDGYKDFLSDYDHVRHIWRAFSDVWNPDFITWWAIFGQNQFSKKSDQKIDELGFIKFGKKYSKESLDLILKNFQNSLKKWIVTPSTPDMLLIGVPLNKTKDELIDQLISVIDNYTEYPQENTAHGNFFISKSKMKEDAVRDCYRTLEIKMRNPDISLIDLAKKSGTLKTSLAGLKNGDKSEFANTVQVGIKRQLNLAVNLAENAARGIFPSVERFQGNHFLYLQLPIFKKLGYLPLEQKSMYEQIQEKVKYESIDLNSFVCEIHKLIQAGRELNIGQIKRSY